MFYLLKLYSNHRGRPSITQRIKGEGGTVGDKTCHEKMWHMVEVSRYRVTSHKKFTKFFLGLV